MIEDKQIEKFKTFDNKILDEMYKEVKYYSKMYLQDKDNRGIFLQTISLLKKMMNQIHHRYTQIYTRINGDGNLFNKILLKYIKENKLIDDCKIEELKSLARKKEEEINKYEIEMIEKIKIDFEIFKHLDLSKSFYSKVPNRALKNIKNVIILLYQIA